MDAEFILFISYVSSTVLLMFILSIVAYRIMKKDPNRKKGAKEFMKMVWRMRSIYGKVVIHIYDTSTDYIILISWSMLALKEIQREQDYENVNMLSFVIPSIVLIFVYRVIYAVKHHSIFKRSQFYSKIDLIIILFDLYLFVFVYQSFSKQYLSPWYVGYGKFSKNTDFL